MTNVMRTAGFLPGVITFAGDFLKAVVAVTLGKYLFPYLVGLWVPATADTLAMLPLYGALLTGFFCLLGHMFPLFYGFRGGKGIVTAAGTMLIIDWRLLLLELAIFAVLFLITRIISVGSLAAAIAYPFTAWLCFGVFAPAGIRNALAVAANAPLKAEVLVPIAAACIAVLVIYKHKDNVRRIFKGEEKKLTLKKNK
jgi:glycerol-3-phosphate acyltransferase PlsY